MVEKSVKFDLITHNFNHNIDNNDSSLSQKTIAFFDFLPKAYTNLYLYSFKKNIINAEKHFHYDDKYKEICHNKKVYYSYEKAQEHVHSFIKNARNRKIATRIYNCKVCGKFHTTSGNYKPVRKYYIDRIKATMLVYSDNSALMVDNVTGNKMTIKYNVEKSGKNINIVNPIITIKDSLISINIDNTENINIRKHEYIESIVNNSYTIIPSDKHLNIHRFATWVSGIVEDNSIFYSSVKGKSGDFGIIILPEKSKDYFLCQIICLGDFRKLKISKLFATKDKKGNTVFKNKNNKCYTINSDIFFLDKTKLNSRFKEMNKSIN